MNNTPRALRTHIAILGRRNAGKSSLINAITDQDVSLVSPVKGTTTDPVYKSMEFPPFGPVVFIDTAGLDDEGELGSLRRKKTLDALKKVDAAIVVFDVTVEDISFEMEIIKTLKNKKIPFLCIQNKSDLEKEYVADASSGIDASLIKVSALKRTGIDTLKKKLISILPKNNENLRIVGDLISPGDFVILVVSIDEAAPKGRLILPQQQTVRDILDSNAAAIIVKETDYKKTIEKLAIKPSLVITDSQVFREVASNTPHDVPLTSFSILFARLKGDLAELVKGASSVKSLKDGDRILIAEACTHHRQTDDIGTVKIPNWLGQYTGKQLNFEFSSGMSFPDDLENFSLIVHCGSCMLNRQEFLNRIGYVKEKGVPIVNYGVLIALTHGILDRALEPFNLTL